MAKSVDSGELLKAVQRQTIKQNKKEKLDVEKIKITNRLAILSKITKKLYEDYACDLLDTDSYHKMLNEYQQEQKQLSKRLSVIQNELEKKDQHFENVQKLSEIIKEYLNVEKLDANMLNQLIERIEIGHPITVDGIKQQEINIIYRFVGTTI